MYCSSCQAVKLPHQFHRCLASGFEVKVDNAIQLSCMAEHLIMRIGLLHRLVRNYYSLERYTRGSVLER